MALLKVALTHFSAIFLCTLLLTDFSFTIKENLVEIIMRHILYLFLKKISHQKKIIIFFRDCVPFKFVFQ